MTADPDDDLTTTDIRVLMMFVDDALAGQGRLDQAGVPCKGCGSPDAVEVRTLAYTSAPPFQIAVCTACRSNRPTTDYTITAAAP